MTSGKFIMLQKLVFCVSALLLVSNSVMTDEPLPYLVWSEQQRQLLDATFLPVGTPPVPVRRNALEDVQLVDQLSTQLHAWSAEVSEAPGRGLSETQKGPSEDLQDYQATAEAIFASGRLSQAAGAFTAIAYGYAALACLEVGNKACVDTQLQEVRRFAAGLQNFNIPYSVVSSTLAVSNATAQLVIQPSGRTAGAVEAVTKAIDAVGNLSDIAAVQGYHTLVLEASSICRNAKKVLESDDYTARSLAFLETAKQATSFQTWASGG